MKVATVTKKLYMTFNLDTGKTKTISLDDPVNNIQASDVTNFMANMVNNDALLVGTARLAGSKTAFVREVSDEILF